MTTMINTDTYRPCLDPMNAPADAPVEPGTPGTSKHASTEPAFTINTEERANWLLRRLANLDAERARVRAQADALLAQIDSDAEGLRFRFGAQLETFARQALDAKGGRRKSLTLLQGTLAFRTVPARVSITDAEAAFVHARAAFPELIETVATLNAAAYRERAEQTGEALPGVEIVPARETFAVRFGKGAAHGEEGG